MTNDLVFPRGVQAPAPTMEDELIERLRQEMLANHQAVKERMRFLAEQVLSQLAEGDIMLLLPQVVAKLQPYQGDFSIATGSGRDTIHLLPVPMYRDLATLQDGTTKVDLVVFSRIDRVTAFGLWSGRRVKEGELPACVVMRPQRLVDVVLPDSHAGRSDMNARYERLQRVLGDLCEVARLQAGSAKA